MDIWMDGWIHYSLSWCCFPPIVSHWHLSCLCPSDPVWFHHAVRCLLPPGTPAGTYQQHHRGQSGLLEAHNSVQTSCGSKSPQHRSLAGNPQWDGHTLCCHKCEYRSTCVRFLSLIFYSVLSVVFLTLFLSLRSRLSLWPSPLI